MSATAERMRELNQASAAVRGARRYVKERIASEPSRQASRRLAMAVLREPDEASEGIRLLDLLRACRYVSDSRARRWLRLAGVSGDYRLGEMAPRQREAVALKLEEYS